MNFIDKITDIWGIISVKIFPIWQEFISIIADLFNLKIENVPLILLGLVIYIIFLIFVSKIHKKTYLKYKKNIRKCVYQYDNIRYLIARAMYFYNQHLRTQGKSGKLVHGTKSILKLEKKDYFTNKEKIFSDIDKLETFLNQEVVPKKIKKRISFLNHKISFFNTFQEIMGIGLSICTFGFYLLVWNNLNQKLS